jgi:hypothetical protein
MMLNHNELMSLMDAKKIELAKSLFSPQFHGFPLRTSKAVLRISGELVELAAKIHMDRSPDNFGDK